ncbi:MAG: hypothetical protein ACYDCM_03355 [Candidatus Acidiferrales bacterium]
MDPQANPIRLYFTDFFDVSPAELKRYGAFNISLLSDLPLFIDPFLLFNSRKPEYRQLHNQIINYLRFLTRKSAAKSLDAGLVRALYTFHEVKQNWLGFSETGNKGSGLGAKFANSLSLNLYLLFGDFGSETMTKASHLEKLCLIEPGVGRDNISDFATNLIKDYLLQFTEKFAKQFIKEPLRRTVPVTKVRFNYDTETWESSEFDLPCFDDDFVLLTPKDMLTRDNTWINQPDLLKDFELVCAAVPDEQLRAHINNYFKKVLPSKPSAIEIREAERKTIREFPQLADVYIKDKENNGDQATTVSSGRVKASEQLYIEQFRQLAEMLSSLSAFYETRGRTYKEALRRANFLKDIIENKGGHKLFYVKGQPLQREADVHILYRLTWFATPSDVSREVNDGRGPADFKISRGSEDKSLVEFKLAGNAHLEKNLRHQSEVYEKASDASRSIKVIIFFSKSEEERVNGILDRLKLRGKEEIVLIDARNDNKPSGSKAA